MSDRERSLLVQQRIRRLRAERERISAKIREAMTELDDLTPARPHTGIMKAVVHACKASGRELSSREIADRCSHLDFHRVQVMAHQAAREGYLAKTPLARDGARTTYVFAYRRDPKGSLHEQKAKPSIVGA